MNDGIEKLSLLPKTIVPKFWTSKEVSAMLRISTRSFDRLRKHPFYSPDASRIIKGGRGGKKLPLWSTQLVELMANARREIAPGIRAISDDEGLEIRNGMINKMREKYFFMIE